MRRCFFLNVDYKTLRCIVDDPSKKTIKSSDEACIVNNMWPFLRNFNSYLEDLSAHSQHLSKYL